jgi:hypothetical protein
VAAAFISDADEEVVKAGWTVDVSEVRVTIGEECATSDRGNSKIFDWSSLE